MIEMKRKRLDNERNNITSKQIKVLSTGVSEQVLTSGIANVVRCYMEYQDGFNIKVNHLPTTKMKSFNRNLATYINTVAVYAFKLLFLKPDIVHIHTASGKSFYRNVPLIWLAGASLSPLIIHIHGGSFGEFMEGWSRKFIILSLRQADLLLAPSRTLANIIKDQGGMNVEVLLNPVEPIKYISRYKNNDQNILYFSGLTKEKGAIDLANCIPLILEKAPNVLFEFCGPGNLPSDLINKLNEMNCSFSIKLRGVVTGDDKNRVFATSSILAFPSHVESFGLVLVEALTAGLPIVAYDIPVVREMLTDEINGIIVPCYDIGLFARAIIKLLTSPEFVESISVNNKKLGEKYSPNKINGDLRRVYEILCKK